MIMPDGVIQRNVISFLVLFSSATNYHGVVANYENKFVRATQSVVVVEGLIAKLPCDVTSSFRGDRIHIVIWYKKSNNGNLTPIYTFDSRDYLLLEQGKHWSDELVLGGRAHFRFQDEPAKLVINSILRNDAGVYQCRVDFKQSPTRSSEVNLTVIVPPKELTILNEKGFQVTDYLLGPYKEGSSINITCLCADGFPSPKLTWWRENALLDDSYENLSENIVRNVLHIERLQREHLDVVLTCQASNNDVVAPISTSKGLDINLRPLSVKLFGASKPLSAGKMYQLICEVVGSRPIPIISWWKGGTKLGAAPATVNTNGNVTISTVNFTASPNDEGKYISCIVEQPLISADIMESRWMLTIHHVPLVSLELSNKLSNTVEEGSDVYFECNIKSKPWVYKVSWKYNGKMLFSNRTAGIIINNQSLVLQDVARDRSGIYTCIGSNQEGDGESNAMRLEITFAPVCQTRRFVTYEVPLHETVRINCEVEANPTAVEFTWEFNNTEISLPVISFYETSATVSYTPKTENDYGTLFCMASNAVGKQNKPCVFHITFIAKPKPVSNCSVLNQTHQSLLVKCAHRLEGGSNQTFVAEVYDTQTHKLLKNISSKAPTFSITGLSHSSEIEIYLYVVTEKTKSTPTRLKAVIPKLEEILAASVPVRLYITPKLSITICVLLVVIFTAVVMHTACRFIGGRKHENGDNNISGAENINPDIIPLRNGEVQEEEGFVDELLQNGSSETYMKLEDPEEVNPKCATNYKFLSPKPQPTLMYTRPQPPPSALPNFYEPILLQNRKACEFVPQHRFLNPKVYETGGRANSSELSPEEWVSANFGSNRNTLQPLLVNRNNALRLALPQQQIKVTQI